MNDVVQTRIPAAARMILPLAAVMKTAASSLPGLVKTDFVSAQLSIALSYSRFPLAESSEKRIF